MDDRFPGKLNCVAEDVDIALAIVEDVTDGCDGSPGDTATFHLKAQLELNASERFDVGVYVAEDGGNALNGDCHSAVLPNSEPTTSVDGDTCGDVDANVTGVVVDLGTVDVPCRDADADGFLDLNGCVGWRQNDKGVCNGPEGAFPGTASKCKCNSLNIIEVPVPPVDDCTVDADCSDQNACNGEERCVDSSDGKVCVPGSDPVVCSALDDCHVAGVCDPQTGTCSNPEADDGAACNDGSACTQTDTCQAGTCSGGNVVVCTASDQCHAAGTCDPATGACSDPPAANGTACNDGDACTQTDTCQAGTCGGSNPVVCTASDQCHLAGTCDPQSGNCSDPTAADGTGCSDGNLCTQTDTCLAGTCSGANPVLCSALDACHVAGVCNPGTGSCSNPNAADGSTCNDANACTQTDNCQAGACTGGNPVVCTALDECHEPGSCDPTDGVCSNPTKANGSSCDDEDACTGSDSCQAGSCTGADPVICSAADDCHDAGTCNPANGICSNPPKADDTACDDGDDCTVSDVCTGGACTAGGPRDCDDDLACTADSCDAQTGCNHAFDPTAEGGSCALETCRTAGFWSTHPGATEDVLGTVGCFEICGEVIDDLTAGAGKVPTSADSAIEAMCVPVQGSPALQLARQLTAAALNCVMSRGVPGEPAADCAGSSIEELFGLCNVACPTTTTATTGAGFAFDCIVAMDCFNNGGLFDAEHGTCRTGTCSLTAGACGVGFASCPTGETCERLAGSCHDRPLVNEALDLDIDQAAAEPGSCKTASKSKCTIVQPGENHCAENTAECASGD